MRVEGLHICTLALRGQNLDLIEIINQKETSKFCRDQNQCSYFQDFWSPLSRGSETAPCPYTHTPQHRGAHRADGCTTRRLIRVPVSSLLLKDDSIYSDANLEIKES